MLHLTLSAPPHLGAVTLLRNDALRYLSKLFAPAGVYLAWVCNCWKPLQRGAAEQPEVRESAPLAGFSLIARTAKPAARRP
jgi:hypothetical protein